MTAAGGMGDGLDGTGRSVHEPRLTWLHAP
jgi:hypothetical protein